MIAIQDIKSLNIETPVYVVDESRLLRNLKLLQQVQQDADVHILCALKGFAMHHYFPKMKDYVHGASASSLHEALLINEKMSVKAHTYLPAYKDNEIVQIARLSNHLIFNSINQYKRFFKIVKASNAFCDLGLRVNPEYSEVKTDLYDPCSPNSRLGIKKEDLPDVLPAEIKGLHFHALCENNSYVFERLLKNIEEKFNTYFNQINWINFGGGHLISHRDYNIEHLIGLLRSFKEKYQLEIYLEPGSAFAWESGFLIATILDIIENGDQKIALMDTSFTCHMPDCLEMPYKPKVYGENASGSYNYILGGSSCLSGDQMGIFTFDKPLQIGEKIVFEDMIHYTMVKTSTFNGVKLPGIARIDESGVFNVIQSFGYNDFKQRLS